MLTEKEEKHVDSFIKEAAKYILLFANRSPSEADKLRRALWLAAKLKMINDECSQYANELQKANEELARIHEYYGV